MRRVTYTCTLNEAHHHPKNGDERTNEIENIILCPCTINCTIIPYIVISNRETITNKQFIRSNKEIKRIQFAAAIEKPVT